MLEPRIGYRDRGSLSAVLEGWTTAVQQQLPAHGVRDVKLDLCTRRPLNATDVDAIVDHVGRVGVAVKGLEVGVTLHCQEFLDAFAHLERLVMNPTSEPILRRPLALPSTLKYLDVRCGELPSFRTHAPYLSTLLLQGLRIKHDEEWYALLEAFPSLRVLGISHAPTPPVDAFTAAHLPASLEHLSWDAPYDMHHNGHKFLHNLPETLKTVTVTELGHYKAKARIIGALWSNCRNRGIDLRALTTGLRRVRDQSVEEWAASV